MAFIVMNNFLFSLKSKLSSNIIPLSKHLTVAFNYSNSSTPINLSYSLFKPEVDAVSPVPLVILHGFLGSKLNWRSLGKAIARKSERLVYTLDARNHGDSPHTDEFSISLMSADLKHFMNKENIPEAVLVGHSMGGRTAVHFAFTHREMVKKLVIVDISPNSMPPMSTDSPRFMQLMKKAITQIDGLNLNQARKAIDKYLSPEIPVEGIRQFLLTNLSEKNHKIIWKPNLDSLLKNYDSGVLEMPPLSGAFMEETLYILGEVSPFVTKNDYPAIKALFPKANIVEIKGAGHWVHSEKPAEFIQTLCDFL